MNLELQTTDLLEQIQKLPKNGKSNRSKDGKRIPMTKFIASALYDKEIDIISFQRTARTYYRTSKTGNLLYLTNEVNNNSIVISFNVDLFGYMSIKVIKNNVEKFILNVPKPKYNSDLFKKIVNKRLL